MNVPEFRNDVDFRGQVEADNLDISGSVSIDRWYEDKDFCSFLRKLQCICSIDEETNVIDFVHEVVYHYNKYLSIDWTYDNTMNKEVLTLLKTLELELKQYLDYRHQFLVTEGGITDYKYIWSGENATKPYVTNFILDMKYCNKVHNDFINLIQNNVQTDYVSEFKKQVEVERVNGCGFIPIRRWPKIVTLISEDYRN